MKLCIPVASPEGLASPLEADFGAARHLLVVDAESGEFVALDRSAPEGIAPEAVASISGVICSAIHPRLLFELQQNGIAVFGCNVPTAADALALFQSGELEPAPAFDPHAARGEGHEHGEGGCCGGEGHGHGEGGCCGGEGHEHGEGGCCGGEGHGHGEGGCCGGEGHGHGHGHGEGGCCGGEGHDKEEGGCCGGGGHGHGKQHGGGHGHGGCGCGGH